MVKDWQLYQACKLPSKLKMENSFRCNFSANSNFTQFRQATVSFITEPLPHRLEVRDISGSLCFTIFLTDLRGYNPEGRTIQLRLRPELSLRDPILEFQSEAVHTVAFGQLRTFAREVVPGGNSPSSSNKNNDVNTSLDGNPFKISGNEVQEIINKTPPPGP